MLQYAQKPCQGSSMSGACELTHADAADTTEFVVQSSEELTAPMAAVVGVLHAAAPKVRVKKGRRYVQAMFHEDDERLGLELDERVVESLDGGQDRVPRLCHETGGDRVRAPGGHPNIVRAPLAVHPRAGRRPRTPGKSPRGVGRSILGGP